MASWLDDTTANRYRKSYFKDFLDLSGNLTVRNGDLDISGGDATISGDVGIGTTSPTSNLHIHTNSSAPTIRLSRDDDSHNGFQIYSNPTAAYLAMKENLPMNFETNLTTRMTIGSTGNVGIGTDNPQRNLTIYNSSNPVIQLVNSSSGTGSHDGMALEQYGTSSFITNKENGNIFFRTQNDIKRMMIQENGQIGMGYDGNIHGGNANVVSIDAKSMGTAVDALGVRTNNDTNNIINFYNNSGSLRGTIKGVNSSSIQYSTSSDRRLKTDIATLQDGLAKVMKLKPRSYRWKENGELSDGFVAQEVFEVLPHFIPHNRFKCDISQNEVYHGKVCSCCDIETKSNGEDYLLGLDYSTFTPYLCKAIQEQQEIIETEKAKTASLETENATLKTQMADVLSRLSALESA